MDGHYYPQGHSCSLKCSESSRHNFLSELELLGKTDSTYGKCYQVSSAGLLDRHIALRQPLDVVPTDLHRAIASFTGMEIVYFDLVLYICITTTIRHASCILVYFLICLPLQSALDFHR